jgi:predicted ATPase
MLTQIKLTNFKCFKEETTFPLSKFNLFTGVNGAGKSSLLQSLLLMRQSIDHNPYTSELILNGSCVNLGSFNDVRNRQISINEPILFEIEASTYFNNTNIFEGSIGYKLEPQNNDMSLLVSEISLYDVKKNEKHIGYPTKNMPQHYTFDIGSGSIGSGSFSSKLILLEPDYDYILRNNDKKTFVYGASRFNFENIHFISADRIGPQELYLKSNLPEFVHVGAKGEHAVNLLNKKSQELVHEELCLGEDAKTLITQTEAWLGKILTPLGLEITLLKANFLELLIGNFRPSNVGFGYSSILPIIVTGLIAKPDEKIIIENPEIHLHPKAQSALVEFLVKVANTGVQIFIESHSDHILNALRIAVLKEQLTSEEANILYFQENEIKKIPIEKDGRIEEWPKDFFDQMDNDFNILFGL